MATLQAFFAHALRGQHYIVRSTCLSDKELNLLGLLYVAVLLRDYLVPTRGKGIIYQYQLGHGKYTET